MASNGSSAEKKPSIVFVLGGPGSGKGTQCQYIAQRFGYTHLSSGDLLRAEIKSGSENGRMLQRLMKDGHLVPSHLIIKLLLKAIQESGNHKFLIDGFPRSDENRAAFEDAMKMEPDFVLFLDCPEEEMTKRLLSRNQGREDDNMESIRKRFKVFQNSTLPVIEYYESKGKVEKINAARPVQEVFESVQAVFTSKSEKAKCLKRGSWKLYLYELQLKWKVNLGNRVC